MMDMEVDSLHQRINALRSEHRRLDALVNRLCSTQVYGDGRLQDLKRRRLLVKDRLAMLERVKSATDGTHRTPLRVHIDPNE